MSKLEDQGFLSIAQNNDGTDYLRLAYAQALSCKILMPDCRYAVLVDEHTHQQITQDQLGVFDHVICLNIDYADKDSWKLANDLQVHQLTPFRETIKLESDILITRNLSHWWNAFRLKSMVFSLGCRNYLGEKSASRQYRRVFDDNDLPDIYTGLMYLRYTQDTYNFFNFAKECWENWDDISLQLKNYRDKQPTTDLVYALAAKILGIENFTIPSCDFINFTHMKNAVNDWPESISWPELVVSEVDPPMGRVNGINQYYPFHYQNKEWMSDSTIEKLETKWKTMMNL